MARAQARHPSVVVERSAVLLGTAHAAALPAHRLGRRVSPLAAHRADLDNAIDMLFQEL